MIPQLMYTSNHSFTNGDQLDIPRGFYPNTKALLETSWIIKTLFLYGNNGLAQDKMLVATFYPKYDNNPAAFFPKNSDICVGRNLYIYYKF